MVSSPNANKFFLDFIALDPSIMCTVSSSPLSFSHLSGGPLGGCFSQASSPQIASWTRRWAAVGQVRFAEGASNWLYNDRNHLGRVLSSMYVIQNATIRTMVHSISNFYDIGLTLVKEASAQTSFSTTLGYGASCSSIACYHAAVFSSICSGSGPFF